MVVSNFERRMRPFVALQAAVASLGAFAGVFVYAGHGAAAVARYAALMYGTAGLSLVLAFAAGMRMPLKAARLAQAGFALPAALLWWADGRPDLLALAIGGFLGFTWGARHWLELQALGNAERDGYATHVIALAVGVTLAGTLAGSGLLAASGDARRPVYALFALVSGAGVLLAGRHLPEAPPIRLERPLAVLRQAAYRDSLPLFLLESGLIGITMVLTASGAMQSLESASDYGWAASAATLAGALALRAMRSRRHSGNRVGWMRIACCGIVAAAALLGASAAWPRLFIAYLLLQAVVSPFWAASEHVLNQRALDIHGAVGDRIAAREGTLAVFRLGTLALFWWATQALDDHQRLIAGACIIGTAAVLEFQLGRHWLAHHHGAAPGHPYPR
ncbi:hypothetical protein [Pelomonas sp. KK5]|uniref:hypothetical protein n=1 Tax=Pelomonas sp. KK5 TaxID=1855730 RepID=UPI00097CB7B7|nr:hypothetical protein [Pelomonas sp. KK5]